MSMTINLFFTNHFSIFCIYELIIQNMDLSSDSIILIVIAAFILLIFVALSFHYGDAVMSTAFFAMGLVFGLLAPKFCDGTLKEDIVGQTSFGSIRSGTIYPHCRKCSKSKQNKSDDDMYTPDVIYPFDNGMKIPGTNMQFPQEHMEDGKYLGAVDSIDANGTMVENSEAITGKNIIANDKMSTDERLILNSRQRNERAIHKTKIDPNFVDFIRFQANKEAKRTWWESGEYEDLM